MANEIREMIFDLIEEDSSDDSLNDLLSSSSEPFSSESPSSGSDESYSTIQVSIENYIKIIEKYTDRQFKQHFRLERNCVKPLIDEYNACRFDRFIRGRDEIGADAEMYITLLYLANTETYRQIANRFNVSKGSVFRVLNRVVDWLVAESPKYIKWPDYREMEANQIQFQMKRNFPKVVAAIDCTHIKINAPRENKGAYCNRKKFYSICLQGIVDCKNRFIDVSCGEPGAMHDARVLRRSRFYAKMQENVNLIVPDGVILGDSAYPDTNYLLTPYKNYENLTEKQKKFNTLHSATRIVVENAFGLLKGRFRRLKFFKHPRLRFVAKCVVAACVLHNICINNNDLEEWIEDISAGSGSNERQPAYQGSLENRSLSRRQEFYEYLDSNNLLD